MECVFFMQSPFYNGFIPKSIGLKYNYEWHYVRLLIQPTQNLSTYQEFLKTFAKKFIIFKMVFVKDNLYT
jgi:hypothetical protein